MRLAEADRKEDPDSSCLHLYCLLSSVGHRCKGHRAHDVSDSHAVDDKNIHNNLKKNRAENILLNSESNSSREQCHALTLASIWVRRGKKSF